MTDVILPKWGLTMEDGVIAVWEKQVGEAVAEGETIAIIETEKIETELPSPADGTVLELLYPEGTTVDIGTVIARIG